MRIIRRILFVLVGLGVLGSIAGKDDPPLGGGTYTPSKGWHAAPKVAWAPMFDEVGAVTDCDLLAKRQLIAPSSMDKAWSWRILEHPERERVTVLQPGDDLALGQHRLEEGIAGVLHAGEGG